MEISIPLDTLAVSELKALIKANRQVIQEKGLSLAGAVEKRDLIDVLTKAGIEQKKEGFEAIKHKSRLILQYVHNLEYTVTFNPNSDLGIELRSNNEWASVVNGPEAITRGSVVVAVNGEPVLLKTYNEAIGMMMTAKQGTEKFTITFRRAPWKTGTLWKAARSKKGKVSTVGWKKRYFVLAYGMLAYYDKKGGTLKGHYMLDSATGHQTLLSPVPASALDGNTKAAIMLCKGTDRLVMKTSNADELMDWAAMLYMAVAHTNGGNQEMYEAEAKRQCLEADRADFQDWMAKAAERAEQDRMRLYLELAEAEAVAKVLREQAAAASAAGADEETKAEAEKEAMQAEHKVASRRKSLQKTASFFNVTGRASSGSNTPATVTEELEGDDEAAAADVAPTPPPTDAATAPPPAEGSMAAGMSAAVDASGGGATEAEISAACEDDLSEHFAGMSTGNLVTEDDDEDDDDAGAAEGAAAAADAEAAAEEDEDVTPRQGSEATLLSAEPMPDIAAVAATGKFGASLRMKLKQGDSWINRSPDML